MKWLEVEENQEGKFLNFIFFFNNKFKIVIKLELKLIEINKFIFFY
jgi:hypothetical protein